MEGLTGDRGCVNKKITASSVVEETQKVPIWDGVVWNRSGRRTDGNRKLSIFENTIINFEIL